ncbi:unnamed protein product [Anisakis simplex]|uniref:Uncharacterized protein n=1 Tax=Anisakis simplex TaxID=6269 RepID=A0A0M3JHJ9_ANISI|nr:unnamed protein product [Anisakis simplex]
MYRVMRFLYQCLVKLLETIAKGSTATTSYTYREKRSAKGNGLSESRQYSPEIKRSRYNRNRRRSRDDDGDERGYRRDINMDHRRDRRRHRSASSRSTSVDRRPPANRSRRIRHTPSDDERSRIRATKRSPGSPKTLLPSYKKETNRGKFTRKRSVESDEKDHVEKEEETKMSQAAREDAVWAE